MSEECGAPRFESCVIRAEDESENCLDAPFQFRLVSSQIRSVSDSRSRIVGIISKISNCTVLLALALALALAILSVSQRLFGVWSVVTYVII